MIPTSKIPLTLPIKSAADAVEEAKAIMQLERQGTIQGLYTRFRGVNRGKMKYWRFSSVTAIAGLSGHGKSAFLTMLEDDFCNWDLNPTFKNKIIVLAFKYEMSASADIIRNLSGKVSKPFAYLLSSELSNESKENSITDVDKYNIVTDEEYSGYVDYLDTLKDRPIRYIESAGNLEQLYNTCAKVKMENPDKQLIVTIDHTLLSKKLTEKDDGELVSNTAHIGIDLKKKLGAMVIFLCQANGEIEKVHRKENPDLNFPVKNDIHYGNQLYWACDDVLFLLKPINLQLEKYGRVYIPSLKKKVPLTTQGLIHCIWLKSRFNRIGSIWFKDELKQGKFIEATAKDFIWSPPMNILG